MKQAIFLTSLLALGCMSRQDLVPPTVDEDPDLPRLTLDDTTLHGEVLGAPDAPLLVLLHGGPGADSVGLRRLTPLTERGWRVLIYDQRGAGRSRRHAAGHVDDGLLAADLIQLIEAHSSRPITLVGHSWGGMLAALTVQTRPDLIREVFLLDPGPFLGERWADLGLEEVDLTAKHLNDFFWGEQMIPPEDHATLDWHFAQLMIGQAPGYHMSDADPMPFERMGYVSYTDVIQGATSAAGEMAWDYAEGLEAWPGTAHFIWGAANTIMKSSFRQAQEADWPNTTSVTIEGAGHDLPWIAAEEIMGLIGEAR